MEDLEKEINDILLKEANEKKVLGQLLDRSQERDNHIVVQKMLMGGTVSYLGSVTLEWLAANVRLASTLPLFKNKLDANGKVIIDSETIDDIQQRPINWSRQQDLAQYIAVKEHHKFPPVLVVATQEWVDNPSADEWNEKKAKTDSASFIPLDIKGNIGLIDISDKTTMYALDGQHRLIGIQGFMDLVKNNRMVTRNKEGKEKGHVTLDDLSEEYSVKVSEISKKGKEKIGIEIIPAVVATETREIAKRRVRSIFVHVNLMAAPLQKGQIAQLDEDNGFAIVAKSCAVTHSLLKEKTGRDHRVDYDASTIGKKKTYFTTLQTMQEMAEKYLKANDKFSKWVPVRSSTLADRPIDAELDEGREIFNKLWDEISKLPSLQEIERGASTVTYRCFSDEVKEVVGKGHLLFRPVGQIALAQALGTIVFIKKFSGGIGKVMEKVIEYDKNGGFEMVNFKSLWYGVIYDFKGKKINIKGKDLAARLMEYLFAGGISNDAERENLRKDLAAARMASEDKAVDFDNNLVDPINIKLPACL